MKKIITPIILMCLIIKAGSVNAGTGDTTLVQAQNALHMSWWGEYNAWAAFPPPGNTYGKILMDFKLGCPNIAGSCSDWDYTVQVEALHHTGQIDSTLNQAPGFTADGSVMDSLYFNLDTTYITHYDTLSTLTVSVPAAQLLVMIYGDSQNPTVATDSMLVFPANYYNYLWNASGVIYDSTLVTADSLWIVNYTPYYVSFEVVEPIELGRVMTPYGGYFPVSWNNTWIFDVTDYALILQDSVEIRAFYGGWSDGFNISVDFRMIEGIPPRFTSRIRNIYSSGPGGFPFGNTGNPIENYLVPKTFDISPTETMSLMRVIPSGHGAGTQNCSEFCSKTYHVLVDGVQTFNQSVWRSDCGMNALYHQAGTWIYDRANWCPGDKTLIRDHDLTPYVTPGDSVTLDMNFDAYTNTVGGQNPNYIIAAQLITYNPANFSLNASIDDIIAPNDFYNYNRSNPVCSHPVVIVKNNGLSTLSSVTIHYGIEGGTMSTYNWIGSLGFLQTAQVTLGSINWGSATGTPDRFIVYTDSPNGGLDEYAYNDTMRSHLTFTPMYPDNFVVVFKTNTAASETYWRLRDESGTIIYQSQTGLLANTIYRDTVNLTNGCYEFTLYDSGKDGLYFFANGDGTGYCRFQLANGTSTIIKTFEADFGTQIGQRFTVGFTTSINEEVKNEPFFYLFPNPSQGKVTLDLGLDHFGSMQLSLYSVTGQKIMDKAYNGFLNDIITLDLSSQQSGVYYVQVKSNNKIYTKKLVLVKE